MKQHGCRWNLHLAFDLTAMTTDAPVELRNLKFCVALDDKRVRKFCMKKQFYLCMWTITNMVTIWSIEVISGIYNEAETYTVSGNHAQIFILSRSYLLASQHRLKYLKETNLIVSVSPCQHGMARPRLADGADST
jgi:hypothetical protein